MRTRSRASRESTTHKPMRERLRVQVERGTTVCVLCGELIVPGTPWDLDHRPGTRGYRGPTHAHCNRSDGAKRGNSRRRMRTSRVW